IGEALGKLNEARTITEQQRREIAEIRAKSAGLSKVRVYMEINHVGPWTSGRNSPENEIISLAGGVNVFGDHDAGVFVTANDEIVKRDPEVILSPIWLNAKVGGID